MNQNQKREECRKAVRAYLAQRSGISLGVSAITRGLKHEGAFTEEHVAEALNHLVSREHVKQEYDGDGSSRYYQITAEGELYHERNA